jgi:hypothetical protein
MTCLIAMQWIDKTMFSLRKAAVFLLRPSPTGKDTSGTCGLDGRDSEDGRIMSRIACIVESERDW